MKRLRDRDQFQGARYEIAIAAIFARLDCEIRFIDEDETLRGKKRVELVATHRPSGQSIAVEAKSRHRAGVINVEGERDNEDPLRGDARARAAAQYRAKGRTRRLTAATQSLRYLSAPSTERE
jgi:hypothetical protein